MALGITVLGCNGSYPGKGGACSGYLVEGKGTRVWVDAGSGTMANLQRHVRFADVDAVVLSHAHPDHWTDVLSYHVVCKYAEERTGVPVYSPAEVLRLFKEVSDDPFPTFDWFVVAGGDQVGIGGLTFTFARTDHGPETLAMRIDGGKRSLLYSSDTGPGWSMAGLGAGVDLAVCEATLLRSGENAEIGHLSARQAAVAASAAGAKRLLLTHIWPETDPEESRREAADHFDGPVDVAAENERYDA